MNQLWTIIGLLTLCLGGCYYVGSRDFTRPTTAPTTTDDRSLADLLPTTAPIEAPESPDTTAAISPTLSIEEPPPGQALPPAPQPLTSAYLPILMFHHIEDVPADHPDAIYRGLAYSPERFRTLLQYCADTGVEVLTFTQLQQIREGTLPLPERAVILSFDDGYANNYTNAFPLLEEYGFKGNFNIITDKIGESDFYMSEDQIADLVAAGHQLCSHTQTHPDLTQLSANALRRELGDSRRWLSERYQTPINCLVYPAGEFNDTVVEVAAADYVFARTTRPGKTLDFTTPHTLPTVRMFPETGLQSIQRWWD